MLKHFNMFNIEQTDDLDLFGLEQTNSDLEPLQAADAVLAGYPEPPTERTRLI